MSILEPQNENIQSSSDVSPLLRCKSIPEISPRRNTVLKSSLKLSTNFFDVEKDVTKGNKKVLPNKNESLSDIAAMSVISLYQRENSQEDMDTER